MKTTSRNIIGIFGGTFDPIHNGHLNIASYFYQQLPLQQLRFIPCYQPVHRAAPIATPAQRLQMAQLAIADQPQFIVDNREILRQGPSYMIDTLQSLRQEFPSQAFCMLIATDTFAHFDQWRNWQAIVNYTHIAVIDRPGFTAELNPTVKNFLQQHQTDILPQKTHGNIILLKNTHGLAISATDIRQKIAQQQTVTDLIPPAVWQYIQQQHLYRS